MAGTKTDHHESWLKDADIRPEIWQKQSGRWAVPQHYTCSYMAMFPPELPHYFISRFTKPGDVVLDPFSGRGTTPVQAMSQSRIGIGNDLNDLAYVLTKGKIANPNLEEVLERLEELERGLKPNEWTGKKVPDEIQMIFHKETLAHLLYLKENLDWRGGGVDSFLTMILMGAMHGPSPGFLSLSMPNTFSMGKGYISRYIDKHSLKTPKRDAFEVLRTRCIRFLSEGRLPGKGLAIHGDVRDIGKTRKIAPGSVKMIFSSPPYLKVIKYGQYNWIRLWWLVGDYREVDEKLDDSHSMNPYLDFMKDVLVVTMPLLDPMEGLACWVIGDVGETNLAETVWESVGSKVRAPDASGEESGYRLLGIVEDKISESEKVTRIWNSEDDKSGKATQTDRILVICHENASPSKIISNNDLVWERMHYQ